MEKEQARIAWQEVMNRAAPALQILAGRVLPAKIVDAQEPGPGDPTHRVVDFLHEWASILDGAVNLDGDPLVKSDPSHMGYPTAEEAAENLSANMGGIFGNLIANPGDENGMIMDPPNPELTVDGCPISEVGRLPLWADRRVFNKEGLSCAVMSPLELAWHMKINVSTVHRMAREGRFPVSMIHYLGGPDVKKRRIGFYRTKVRQFMYTWKGRKS